MIYFATSSQHDVYIFIGLTESYVTSRCQVLESRIHQALHITRKLRKLWDRVPTAVHFFIGPNDPWNLLLSVLPPTSLYESIQKMVFTLVERPQPSRSSFTIAEEWISTTKSIIRPLSGQVICHLEIDNPTHYVEIAPLEYMSVKVDVFCMPTDTTVMHRVTELTAGKEVELRVNALNKEHLEHLPRRLTKLTTPFNSCRRILPAISSLRHLRSLTLSSDSNSISPVFEAPPGAFPSLEELKCDMLPFHALKRVCEATGGTLKSIIIDLPTLSKQSDFFQLAHTLSQRCQSSLENLYIRIHGVHRLESDDWHNVLPLQSLTSIQSFVFEHLRPVVLTPSGIRTLLSAWSNARVILLNPRLSVPRSSGWTLCNIDVLVALRRYAPPTLEHFGIVIDPQIARNPLVQHSSLPLMRPSNLRSLDIGTFRVAGTAYELQVFPILHILFSGCTIEHGA